MDDYLIETFHELTDDELEAMEDGFEEGHLYSTIDDFEQLLVKYGPEFLFDHMTAEGVQILKEAFLGCAD